jgi:hypothetical protein
MVSESEGTEDGTEESGGNLADVAEDLDDDVGDTGHDYSLNVVNVDVSHLTVRDPS